MTGILPEPVVSSDVLYVSFRVALVALIDELMGESMQMRCRNSSMRRFLDRFTLLRNMAPQVQLECLLTTWDRIQQRRGYSLLDEAVCFAASQQLSELSLRDEKDLLALAWRGPRKMDLQMDHWVCSHVRSLQVALLPCLRTWQLEVIPRTDPDCHLAIVSLSPAERAERRDLVDLVGRWRISSATPNHGVGLLTAEERELLGVFFEEHPGLLA